MQKITEDVKKTILKYQMIKNTDSILVCVSGGPDSVALFYLLKDANYKIKVCHYNHNLRGKESEKDEWFVKNLCRLYNIKCITGKEKTKPAKYSEDTLRKKRYGFFLKTAKKQKCNTIATAHTFDDQVETLFLRLIRGTGISGIAGIPAVRRESGIKIVRPLIETKRRLIMDFLDLNKYRYRIDKTNQKGTFLRNRVRNRILPFIEQQIKTDIRKNIFYLSCIARDENDFVDGIARNALKKICPSPSGTIKLNLKKLKKYRIAILRRIIRLIFKQRFGLTLNFEEVEKIISLSIIGGEKINLRLNTFVYREKDCLIIT
jgi:tRNA(Ile)-lysidine synthase